MPETSSISKHSELQSEGGKSSQAKSALEGLLWRQDDNDNDSSGGQKPAPVSENSKPPSRNAATTSLNWEEGEKSAAVPAKGKQSDETIENLVSLFRDFLEAAPNPATSNHTHTQQNMVGHKRFFGLNKSLSPETGSNNRYDYEQKYPRDRFGDETADNARVWLTYLDEAELFDRERVEGWKETADVLLVFAGLFSGVITTFVSQASQSLQQDNTQVAASLLSETVQILRAQFSGVPISHVPNSTLTPTSPFTPSTNAFLVNGLWFTSLAITLSTALFAVLAKQWLYYYLSSISGTAHEKARARRLRFKGFELWKVGAIVDLLPILLHLAVGIFLMGIIILLFPLDVRVAWTIVVITGITYTLYFISVILPIRYPECPYTTSLTIYVGILFFFLQKTLRWNRANLDQGSQAVQKRRSFQAAWGRIKFQAVLRRIHFQALDSIQRLLHYIHGLSGFSLILKLVRLIGCGFPTLRPTIFSEDSEFPKFTNWREENIKKAVANAAFLDFEALYWLYETSPNRSVHRILARCAAVHPSINQQFGLEIFNYLSGTLEVNETNVVDLHYGLCQDLVLGYNENWALFRSIPDVVKGQLEEAVYRTYSRIAEGVINRRYDRFDHTLDDVTDDWDLELPLAMWHYFLKQAPKNATTTAHMLIYEHRDLFEWEYDPTCESIQNAGVVSFRDINRKREWWKFDYLYRFFFNNSEPDYSLDKAFEIRYLLLVSIYRNLTSDQPLIGDKEQRHRRLCDLFRDFCDWLPHPDHPSRYVSLAPEKYLVFFKDICCADEFWSDSMTDTVRYQIAPCLNRIWNPTDTDMAVHFPFTEYHDLSLIYQWHSRDPYPRLSPMFALLLMPQNRRHLSTILSNDQNAVSHFSTCLQNSWSFYDIHFGRKYIYTILMDLLKSVSPKMPDLFTVLYDPFVLAQLWRLLVFSKLDAKKLFLCAKSKLDQEKLDQLYVAMNEQARSDDEFEVWKVISWQLSFVKRGDVSYALEASVREFGQIIGVSHPQPMSTTEQSSVPEGAANRGLDIEERAQVSGPSERKGFYSVANWTKVFQSIWSKTRIRGARFTSETELQDL